MGVLDPLPDEVLRSRAALLKQRPTVVAVLAKKGLLSSVDGQDRVQEVFARALPSLPNFEPGTDGAKRWVARVARNCAVDAKRAAHYHRLAFSDEPEKVDSAPAPGPSPERELAIKRVWELVFAAVDALPESERVVFEMHAFGDLTHQEIGEKLGISEDASKMRYARAKKHVMEAVPELADVIAAVFPPSVEITTSEDEASRPWLFRIYDYTTPVALLFSALCAASFGGMPVAPQQIAHKLPDLPALQWKPAPEPAIVEDLPPAPSPRLPASPVASPILRGATKSAPRPSSQRADKPSSSTTDESFNRKVKDRERQPVP